MNGRATIQKSADVWNAGDRDAFIACYTEDCEITSNLGTDKGHSAVAAYWAAYYDPCPGIQVRVGVLIEVGDAVAEEAVSAGTNTGPSRAPDGSEIPPTGREFTVPFAALHTVRDGKITSSRFYWNDLAVLGQLGLLG